MKLPAAGRTTVWATAISVSALVPHTAPAALGLAVAKEGFDLLHARTHRGTVLSYIRAVLFRLVAKQLHVGWRDSSTKTGDL